MIYTCTLNPSVDYIVELSDFRIGGLNRAMNAAMFPGGKGINVSRVLKRLGIDSTALGFIGGFTGTYLEDALKHEGIGCNFVKVDGHTRINIKLKCGHETEINGQGPAISPECEAELIRKVEALHDGDVLVVAGSVPSSLSECFHERLAETAKKRQMKVAVDTSGPALKTWMQHRPFFVKPNHRELGELFDVAIYSKQDAAAYGRRLVERGAEHVIVSLAGEGALFLNEELTLFAEAPKGIVKNSVGAGDSMVAGFLAAHASGKTIEQSFAYSVAAGSATAFSQDLCTSEMVEQLLHKVKVIRM